MAGVVRLGRVGLELQFTVHTWDVDATLLLMRDSLLFTAEMNLSRRKARKARLYPGDFVHEPVLPV